MKDSSAANVRGGPSAGTSGERRTAVGLVVLAVAVTLVLCGCASAVFLVLTGIIAEPETVIEQLLRAILGG